MRLDTYKEKKFHEQFEPPVCTGCGKTIAEQELSDVEYVRTKRKTDIFFHRDCKNKIWR